MYLRSKILSMSVRFCAIACLSLSLYACGAYQRSLDEGDKDPALHADLRVIIRDLKGYPCAYIREVQSDFTPTGNHYYRVLCLNANTFARYTVLHNPYAPRGTSRTWIVEHAAY
jgi:hypothetical protein